MVGLHSEKDNLFSVCMIFEKQQIIYQVGKQPMLNSRPLSKMNYSLLQGVRKCWLSHSHSLQNQYLWTYSKSYATHAHQIPTNDALSKMK